MKTIDFKCAHFENFQQQQQHRIGFTMYTTCVIWLAFVPLYFGTGNHVPLRLTSMSVTISLSASVTVACLFSPKVSNSYAMHALNYYCSSTNNLGWLCGWLSASSLVQKQSTLVFFFACVCLVLFWSNDPLILSTVCMYVSVWFESAYGVRYSSFTILATNHWNFVMMWCQFSDPLYKSSLY